MKNLIRKLLKCSPGMISWRYGCQDFDTISGQLAYRFYQRVEWWQELPWRLRCDLKNWLKWLAAKIDGDRNYYIGYGIETNLAGMLEDEIRTALIMKLDFADWEEPVKALGLLASLAKAQGRVNYERLEKEYAGNH